MQIFTLYAHASIAITILAQKRILHPIGLRRRGMEAAKAMKTVSFEEEQPCFEYEIHVKKGLIPRRSGHKGRPYGYP